MNRTEAARRSHTADPDHVVVRVRDTRFAVALDALVEVLRNPPIGRLPRPPTDVVGLTSVRGHVVPVVDLGLRMLGEPCELGDRLLVASPEAEGTDRDGWGGRTAIRVDAVEEIVRISGTKLSDPPAELRASAASDHIRGIARVGDRSIAVLRSAALGIQPTNGVQAR